jgi:hypothetical protein
MPRGRLVERFNHLAASTDALGNLHGGFQGCERDAFVIEHLATERSGHERPSDL